MQGKLYSGGGDYIRDEYAGHTKQPPYTHSQANTNARIKRQHHCKVCKVVLKYFEKEFYPCNCKYAICYSCYYNQVDNKGRKCPNCEKHYEVNRVEEYKQSRMVQANADSANFKN